MNSIFRCLLSHFALCLFSCSVLAQNESETEEIIVNQLIDESEVDAGLSDYAEALSQYLKRPLDLNKVTAADLNQLIFLSPFQVQQILLHREKAGPFISTLELQAIPSINLETLERLLPFVRVNENLLDGDGHWREILKEPSGSWMMTYSRGLQVPRGYEIADPKRSRYLGSPDRVINRIRWNARKKLKVSLNMKKDAGEPFSIKDRRMGFDYTSGSILINKLGPFDQIVVGDYLLQFGQGLSLWNGPVVGRSASVANIMQQGLGIRPHTGMMESKFMRGMAIRIKRKSFELSPFFSYNNLSASLNTQGKYPFVESINYSGLHRTPTDGKIGKGSIKWSTDFKWAM
ncbi:helix-hairpin-helix domain-containing protein [Sphingobacterium sp.]|uniref:ComEA family DNA-binding protein n=1 Tax=Sphingobacterium sp. TaxID=341027 RepID=UPI0028AA2760|nr:helix-hairpin-helix domain-containing protein [Sphingobacterium sp.]